MALKYDFKEKVKELKEFLQMRGINITKEINNIEVVEGYDNCTCHLTCEYKNKIIEIMLTNCSNDTLSIFYYYWHSSNNNNFRMSPVVSFSIMDLSSEKVMFGYIINKSFYTFIEMLNIYLKNYKEIEDGEVKFQF